MFAGSQQVIQSDGQVHQLVECEGDVSAGQLLTDILAQTAAIMVNQGPVVPSRAGSQGPKLQGKLLGSPRPLPQVEEVLTCRSTLGWVVEDLVNSSNLSKTASPSLHTALASEARDEGYTLSRSDGAGWTVAR
jgi:hypothetical protein